MKSTRVLKKPVVHKVSAGASPPTKGGLIKALEGARHLKSRFPEGSLDFNLASAIEKAIEGDLALCELSEQFAEIVLEEAAKVAATGGAEAVKEFFAAGEKVVKSLQPTSQ
jgi:hypothetical protein